MIFIFIEIIREWYKIYRCGMWILVGKISFKDVMVICMVYFDVVLNVIYIVICVLY